MDIEDLNKSQLILLTVLVNFVTAVATGILTVSLLDQAPPIVAQTVNSVVERTVETVTQVAPAAVIQAPKPSVEELITAAFAADAARTVTIYDAKVGTSTPLATGIFLPKAHTVVTLADAALPKEVLIGFADGSHAPASLAKSDDVVVLYGFADDAELPSVPTVSLVAAQDLKIGQTALALAADGSGVTGIVSKVSEVGIYTSLPKVPAGAAVVDLSGNVIAIGSTSETGLLMSTNRVRDLLAATSTPATPVPSS